LLESNALTVDILAKICANGGSGGQGSSGMADGSSGRSGFCDTAYAFTLDDPMAGGGGGAGSVGSNGSNGNNGMSSGGGGGGGGGPGRIRLRGVSSRNIDGLAIISPTPSTM
jgi:hypothetical protein